ncbi:MAG TPA: lysozyme [Ktedonobacteraceae bacterium]|nr:lysozyme [Ktedonobacteraceae bacterium]
MNSIDIATALCKKFEGCSLTAYPDPATGGAPWTIGYGATGPSITQGTVWTQDEADEDLQHRLISLATQIERKCQYVMNENELGACISLAYNIGIGAFLGSTLFKDWNAGNAAAAAEQFLVWNKAAGRVMAGLATRREAEREVFLGGVP